VISEDADSLMELVGVKLRKPMRPFIVVPTTAGTGSEVTYAAMIRDPEKNQKLLFASYQLFPKTAILDPRMTVSLPPLVTAATAIDALTHAIEAVICKPNNPFSDAHAMMAITLIREHLPEVLADGNNLQGRYNLANAACMAGAAFSNSGVGVIHALGHALGGVCHVPHGVAMNIFLTHGIAYNLEAVGDAVGRLLLAMAGAEVYVRTPQSMRSAKTIEEIQKLQDRLYELTQLPRTLGEAGVKPEALEEVAQKTVMDAALGFNPLPVGYEDALGLLKKAY
jgi:alcohol dehydrogenase